MPRHIVVPLDGSPFSEQALPLAFDLARGAEGRGRVDLITVHEPIPDAQGTPVLDPRFDESLKAWTLGHLAAIAEKWSESGVTIHTEMLTGPVADSIGLWVRDQGVDLIVMTSHGRGGLSRLWLGSTAETLVRRCQTPVLLIRPGEDVPAPRHLDLRRILVPLDGTGFGEEIVDHAVAFAGNEGVEYTLIQVIAAVPAVLSAASIQHDEKTFEARELVASDYLDLQASRIRAQGANVRTVVLSHEHAARALVDYVEENGIDLIAMATHGRGEVSRALFGSVADKILRSCHVPMLLVRGAR